MTETSLGGFDSNLLVEDFIFNRVSLLQSNSSEFLISLAVSGQPSSLKQPKCDKLSLNQMNCWARNEILTMFLLKKAVVIIAGCLGSLSR